MFVRTVSVRRYRSIEDTALESCGRFNVLIGKNNSGKSNLLNSIVIFFSSFRSGDIVSLRPVVTADVDFYNRQTGNPVAICVVFEITLDDLKKITDDLNAEAPQVKNAIAALTGSRYLKLTVKFFHGKNQCSMLSKVALSADSSESHHASDHMLFEISDADAPAIIKQRRAVSDLRVFADNLSRAMSTVDYDSYMVSRRESEGPRSLRYMMDRAGRIPPDVYMAIEGAFTQAETYSDFQQLINGRISQVVAEIQKIESSPVSASIATISGDATIVPPSIRNIADRLSRLKVHYQRERREPVGATDAERLLTLKVRRGGDKQFRAFQQTVNALVGVEVDAFAPDLPTRQTPRRGLGENNAELDVDNFLAQANGSGVREALRLLLDIELEPPDIVLVEEPEIHLHPALEISMMQYLKAKSANCQVFITTHSTNFIDTGNFSAIHFVRKDPATNVMLLTSDEAAEILPKELGLRLSSLFMYEKLIFLEGVSDEDVVREWSTILGHNLGQANVGFITLDGSRNVKHFASNKTVEFLKRRGVQLWFVLDRDERDSRSIESLQKILDKQAKIKVLNAREIENYLASPKALRKFLNARLNAKDVPEEKEIQNFLSKIADELKPYTLAKHLFASLSGGTYVRPDFTPEIKYADALPKIQAAVATAQQELAAREKHIVDDHRNRVAEFERIWTSQKMQLVPGEELLDRFLQRFHLRYRKERDAKQIAAFMEPHEIPQEVQITLGEIVA